MTTDPEVLLAQNAGLGHIILNRPKVINALNHHMVQAITGALRAWAVDPAIRAVVLTGAGERGLCAGGDIVAMYHDATHSTYSASEAFWRDEYHLNYLIANYPKPYVAIMDGIVMGGGVGLSAHADCRIATSRSQIGMPETTIGFVPDVGGTHLLAQAPGELGTHLALTSARMAGADAIAAGFADHYVRAHDVPAFLNQLTVSTVDDAVAQFATGAPASELSAHREWIDACYQGDSAEQIVDRLRQHANPAARAAGAEILRKSPTALKVTLRSLRRAAKQTLAETLTDEYRVSLACIRSHDMAEGIRAQVIDKDRDPRWQPASLADVTDAEVDRYFAAASGDLGLTAP